MLEVSKESKSLRMKINELVTTLDDKNLTEAGGFSVQSDTIAKLVQNFPNWQLGLPHPESNEPTMTQQELIKYGIVDPKNPKKVDPQADPRYFGPDGQERKAANKRAKDKFGDRPVTFSKSPTDYLTQAEWDYKYGRTHNPDGSPKKIDTKNTSNNPQALKNKQFKSRKLNSNDVKDLDKTLILFKTPGKFDSFSGIGSMQDVPGKTLQSNYDKFGPTKNRQLLKNYFDAQAHTVYGFVDSFRDKDVKLIDDENIEGIKFTGADSVPKNTSTKDLTPGQDTLPGSTGLSSDYKSKTIEYYKKLHKFYKPYYELLMSDNPGFMDESKWLNKSYKPNDDINTNIYIPRIPASVSMVKQIKKRLAGLGYPNKPYMPEFGSKASDVDPDLKFLTIEPPETVVVPAEWETPMKTQDNIPGFAAKPNGKDFANKLMRDAEPKAKPKAKRKTKKAEKNHNESVLRKVFRQTEVINEVEVIRTDLPDLPDLNPKTVQIVNPEFANDGKVVPRPADPSSGEKGEPSKVAKGDGINWNQFTDETKKVWKDMYGGNFPTPVKVGLSEKEPGNEPNSDKSVNKRFFAVISRDGVLYVQDEQDELWYPSRNDLLYARAVERLYGLKIIDHGDKNIFKGTQNVQTLLKRLWKNKGNLVPDLIKKNLPDLIKKQLKIGKGKAKPNDPGSTKSDYFDK